MAIASVATIYQARQTSDELAKMPSKFEPVKGEAVLPPAKLAHLVLRTTRETEMTKFYQDFLGARITHQAAFGAFLSYDDEHHRIAIMNIPGTGPKVSGSSGLEHVAFTYEDLPQMLSNLTHERASHGPTVSMYYRDIDGNKIETQVDVFKTSDEANAYMESDAFRINPLGVDFDPEEMIRKLEDGASIDSLLPRPESGPREMDTIPSAFMA
ncbi:MAG: hypothetical protein Q9162_000225 [Coniocarpon cinnabarinum]